MKLSWQQSGGTDHELIWASVGLALLLASALLPVDAILRIAGYACPFRAMTGLPCVMCGGTRAWVAMGALHLRSAFALNPLAALGWCATAAFVPYGLFVSLTRRRRLRITRVSGTERALLGVSLALVLVANWAYVLASR